MDEGCPTRRPCSRRTPSGATQGLEKIHLPFPAEQQAHDVERPGERLQLHVDMNRAVLIDPQTEAVPQVFLATTPDTVTTERPGGAAPRRGVLPTIEPDMHADEVTIDISLVRQLVAMQFPKWADLPIRPVAFGGWDNRTFHLGEHMTVRLPSAARYSLQVAKEHRWLPRLAPRLPLPVPVPLAMGAPEGGYPWHWSVYRWLEGEPATIGRIADLSRFATTLAQFLMALQRIDATGGPPPGQHNFFRGGPLAIYDAETRQAIATLDGQIDTDAATAVWQAALGAAWRGSPVWVHGDVSAGNLLVRRGRLSAVIDFGSSGVGDPACDLSIAWTLLQGTSRDALRAALPLDRATWARGRGWTLWKGLITLGQHLDSNPLEAEQARRVIDEVLADHERAA
jgi:aminoglycoside phosphotransferase (APT) family kinase protein